jgi:hypothetical protein
MTWVITGIIGFVVTVYLATIVRDQMQARLAHCRKLKSSGSHNGNRALLILLLPLVLYIVVGTLLFLLLYVMEMATKRLRRYWGVQDVEVITWHQANLFLTLLFPLTWPITALVVGLVFVGAVFLAVIKTVQKVLKALFRFVRRIWLNIIQGLQSVFEWIVDRLYLVWEWVVEKTQLVLGQLATLIHDVWTTIHNTIRL